MKKALWTGALVVCGAWLAGSSIVRADDLSKQITGKEFDGAVVKDFYLEGNAIPTQKRNAALLACDCGKRALVGLLDTSGYSTEIQKKYTGMMILEKKTTVGTAMVPVGAYGFGVEKEGMGAEKLIIYDVGGGKVAETEAKEDAGMKQPVPLQVVVAKDKPVELCLGRYCVDVK